MEVWDCSGKLFDRASRDVSGLADISAQREILELRMRDVRDTPAICCAKWLSVKNQFGELMNT